MTQLPALADISEDGLRITVECDYRCKDQIKAVPGARWDTTLRQWTVPLSWTACLALRAEFGDGLTIGEELREWAAEQKALKAMLADMHSRLTSSASVLSSGDFDRLYEHQKVDALAISAAERYLLLNGTGTGKTWSALAGLRLIGSSVFPVLIVAPKSMLRTWEREIGGFFPGRSVSVIAGTAAACRKALEPGSDFYVVAWDSLRKYSRLKGYGSISLSADEKTDKELQALGLQAIVLDECHRAKNPTSKRTRAAWAVAHGCSIRLGMTGSPIQDTVEDLFGLLHLLRPDEYPSKTSYLDRYCETDWNLWGGRDVTGIREDRAAEFYANFRAISRQITKEMGLPDLPPKLEEIRWVQMTPTMKKAYNSMRNNYIAELSDGSVLVSENQLVRAGRLMQLANAEMHEDEDGVFHMTDKCPKVDQFMEDLIEGDYGEEQIVVFSDSIDILDACEKKLVAAGITFVRIDGSVTGDMRQAAMDVFQAGEARICLLTRAGGEGITLTAASVMVRLFRSWSYIVHQQVEDRVHRIGSERHESVLYVDYIMEGTIEEAQMIRLNAKDARAKEALQPSELLTMLTSEPRL